MAGITILGGEMLCALGDRHQRLEKLRRAVCNPSRISVNLAGQTSGFPYHRLDENCRRSDPGLVIDYLSRITKALLASCDPLPTPEKTGLFLGSSAIDYSLAWPIEEAVDEKFVERCPRERVGGGGYLNTLQQIFGFQGPALTYNTACSSSANALLGAATFLESRIIDHALVFGLELYSPTTLEGFAMMQLLSPEKARPFSVDRSGIVLGEAVSVCLLSRADIAASNWQLCGGNSACDTFSVTGADPEGGGFARVIRSALAASRLQATDIALIKTHGTASEVNDPAELRALEQVFGELPPYISLKPFIGHTLGACGVAELLLLIEALNAGFVPPTLNFSELESGFKIPPVNRSVSFTSGYLLLNYFGFGGSNTSLVVAKTAI